ncbi:hypothetical protein PFISCL1PPCAC_10335, partial [Pristionchus fissidentatus]
NQCCAYKGKKTTQEDTYTRTNKEYMSMEENAKDRLKKTISTSASDPMVTPKLKEEESDEESKEVSPLRNIEESERAQGGSESTTVSSTLTVHDQVSIAFDSTPKRAPREDEMREEEETSKGNESMEIVETARQLTSAPTPIVERTPEMDEFGGEEEDVMGEMIPSQYDLRPMRPLPTPLRKVDITPTRNIEMFCDDRGRVKRNEKILRYLDDKRRSYESTNNI